MSKKQIKTDEMKPVFISEYHCDICDKKIGGEYQSSGLSYDYRHSDGYDEYGDRSEICSLKCLKKMLSEQKYNDYHYGDGPSIYIKDRMTYDDFVKVVLI